MVTPELVHRICYQSDTHVVTACGIAWADNRDQVKARKDLTTWRGSQTCPDCPDEIWAGLPIAARMLLNPKKFVTGYNGPMIDLHEFARRMTDKLMTLAGEAKGVSRIEAVRRYHSDPTFHAQVDTIVGLAVECVQEIEQVPVDERSKYLEGLFGEEASSMLGWRS